MISLDRASLRYGPILGLSPTSFELPEGGGITGLLGPNGAGKSSLIQLLAGLLPPRVARSGSSARRPSATPLCWPVWAWCPKGTACPRACAPIAGCG